MSQIHPTAVISPTAKLGPRVAIGPFVIIEDGVEIGAGSEIMARATIKSHTRLGAENTVHEGAVLGGLPQHLAMGDSVGRLDIGDGNIFRENVTVHRAWREGHRTTIGDRCMLMVASHVAHDCELGDQVIIANNVMLAGHVSIGARAYISGAVGVHQFCRIGRQAMVGGQAHVARDVPPFVTVDGDTTQIVGLNLIGLRRGGFSREQITELKAAYRIIYRSGMLWEDMLSELEKTFDRGPASEFAPFLRTGQRGFIRERSQGLGRNVDPPTLRIHDRAA